MHQRSDRSSGHQRPRTGGLHGLHAEVRYDARPVQRYDRLQCRKGPADRQRSGYPRNGREGSREPEMERGGRRVRR